MNEHNYTKADSQSYQEDYQIDLFGLWQSIIKIWLKSRVDHANYLLARCLEDLIYLGIVTYEVFLLLRGRIFGEL